MSLGVTWWHGWLGNPNAVNDGPIPKRNEEKALKEWEATMAWEGQKRSLEGEANALLKSAGEVLKWKGGMTVLLSEESQDASPPKVGLSETQKKVVAAVVMLILTGEL